MNKIVNYLTCWLMCKGINWEEEAFLVNLGISFKLLLHGKDCLKIHSKWPCQRLNIRASSKLIPGIIFLYILLINIQSNWNTIFNSELPKHASASVIVSFTSKLYKHLWWVQRKHYISKMFFSKITGHLFGEMTRQKKQYASRMAHWYPQEMSSAVLQRERESLNSGSANSKHCQTCHH